MLGRESFHGSNFPPGSQDSASCPLSSPAPSTRIQELPALFADPQHVFPWWAYGGNTPPSTDLFLGISSRSPVAAQGPQAPSSVCFALGRIIPDPSHPFYFYTSKAVSTPISAQTWASRVKVADTGGGLVAQRADAERKAKLLGKEQCTSQHIPLHNKARAVTQTPTQTSPPV